MTGAQYRRFVAIAFWVMMLGTFSLLSLAVLTIAHFVVKFW